MRNASKHTKGREEGKLKNGVDGKTETSSTTNTRKEMGMEKCKGKSCEAGNLNPPPQLNNYFHTFSCFLSLLEALRDFRNCTTKAGLAASQGGGGFFGASPCRVTLPVLRTSINRSGSIALVKASATWKWVRTCRHFRDQDHTVQISEPDNYQPTYQKPKERQRDNTKPPGPSRRAAWTGGGGRCRTGRQNATTGRS